MHDHTPTPPGFVAIKDLPSTFRGYDFNAAILDTGTLMQFAGAVADAWQTVMALGTENVNARERMGALVWLQVDLCEALHWKIRQLDDTHRLVARNPAGAVSETAS